MEGGEDQLLSIFTVVWFGRTWCQLRRNAGRRRSASGPDSLIFTTRQPVAQGRYSHLKKVHIHKFNKRGISFHAIFLFRGIKVTLSSILKIDFSRKQ